MNLLRLGSLVFLLLGLSNLSAAQTMYRCGNAYQDHACDSAANEKIVGGAKPSAASTTSNVGSSAISNPATPASADAGYMPSSNDVTRCQSRGAQAEKIMWAREGGATQQQQVAAGAHSFSTALIADVYARRGTAAEVKSAVQTDCLADTRRALEAARLNAAAAEIMAGTRNSAAMDGSPRVSTGMAPAQGTAVTMTAPVGRCGQLNDQAERLAAQQRAGANSASMANLNAAAVQNQNDRRSAGC